jgi:hypothetical protein
LPSICAVMAPYTGPTLSLHVHITVAPENVDLFLSHLKPCYDVVSAEPECIYFEVFQNPAVPGEFKFVENWNASPEWFQIVRQCWLCSVRRRRHTDTDYLARSN